MIAGDLACRRKLNGFGLIPRSLLTLMGFSLRKQDRLPIFGIFLARLVVGLIDPTAVLLLGLTVNLLLIGPDAITASNEWVYARFGLNGDGQAYARLIFLFWLGVAVVSMFVLKASLSALLHFASTRHFAKLQSANVEIWTERLFSSTDANQNSSKELEVMGHVLTTGATAIYQRTLANLLTVASEVAILLLTVGVLLTVQPGITVGTIAFLVAVTLFIQKVLGGFFKREGERLGALSVSSSRLLRQTILSYRELRLAGTMGGVLSRFNFERNQIALATARIQAASQLPRYFLETVLVIGAFVIAAIEYTSTDFAQATSVVVLFLAAGSRLIPSLITVLNSYAEVRGAIGDVDKTFALLDPEKGQYEWRN
jgi:ATP-binding cassette subfamily C protein